MRKNVFKKLLIIFLIVSVIGFGVCNILWVIFYNNIKEIKDNAKYEMTQYEVDDADFKRCYVYRDDGYEKLVYNSNFAHQK